MSRQEWEVTVGLEVHVQLATAAKIFSGAATAFGAEPNTQACAIDLGLPGTLPVVNAGVFEKAVMFGAGIGAEFGKPADSAGMQGAWVISSFDRKNYFYPDLPKGYQITQMQSPIVQGGSIDITLDDGSCKTINIHHAHLEEDAGKSLHEDFHGMSGIDLNRAGTPLLEIVTEPDMSSAEEAVACARAIHQLVVWLGVSDGKMAEGSLRCDVNVSIRRPGDARLGTRTETKNVNSFRFLQRVVELEAERQATLLEAGGQVEQLTLLYDPERDETRPMRSKETATDYRYFPEPDLLPVAVAETYISSIKSKMPELPVARQARFQADLGLGAVEAALLVTSRTLADYFEQTADACQDPMLAANWVKGDLLGNLNRDEMDLLDSPVTAQALGGLLLRVKDGAISGKIAKQIFSDLWAGKFQASDLQDIDGYIKTQGLEQMSGADSLAPIIEQVLEQHPEQVAQFRAGKTKVLGYLVGQVMKETQGTANPREVNDMMLNKLGNSD